MEKRDFSNKIETQFNPDYLNEKLKVSFSIEPEAVKFLPKVNEAELKSKKEKYAILIGSKQAISNDKVHIHIKAVMEIPESQQFKQRYYKEDIEIVKNIDTASIKKLVEAMRSLYTEYHYDYFLGDVHTHPIKPSELGGNSGCQPSIGDIEGLIDEYENGNIDSHEPFIFGIAAPDESGETEYAFYRIIKTDKGHTYKHLD